MPARDQRASAGRARAVPPTATARGGAWRGHGPVGGRNAPRHGGDLVPGQVQSHPRSEPRQPNGAGAMRRAQPGHQRGSGALGRVLCARPQQPDRLHHWRQRGRELGRRALPEIRPDAAQRAQTARLHRATRTGGVPPPTPPWARCIMAGLDELRKAGGAVAAVIAAGITPAGLEMMDKPMTAAVEDFVHAGYDLDAQAILLCESDGTPEEVAEEIDRMLDVLVSSGATRAEVSRDEAQRLRFWSGRKNAFPASGRISP